MTESGQFASVFETRLIGIDFPGMDVKDKWYPGFVDGLKCFCDKRVGHEPEITASGNGKVLSENTNGRDWELK